MERQNDADYEKACTGLVVEGRLLSAGRERPGRTLSADMRLLKVDPRDIHDRKRQRAIGGRKANLAAS